jgi:hypothetical protein
MQQPDVRAPLLIASDAAGSMEKETLLILRFNFSAKPSPLV